MKTGCFQDIYLKSKKHNKKFKADTGSRPVRFNSLLCPRPTGAVEFLVFKNFWTYKFSPKHKNWK